LFGIHTLAIQVCMALQLAGPKICVESMTNSTQKLPSAFFLGNLSFVVISGNS
jgi:hypothetical protein